MTDSTNITTNTTDDTSGIGDVTTSASSTDSPLVSESTSQVIVASVVGVLTIVGLILNVFYVVAFCRVKGKVRAPISYFFLNLALIDLLGLLLWTPFLVISGIQGKWTLGDDICTLQGVVSSLHLTLTMHTLFLITLERCARMRWPSKHAEVFHGVVIAIMLCTLWPFDLVIAMFPVMTWGTITYIPELIQCTVDLKEDHIHHALWFSLVFGLPVLLGAILLLLSVLKWLRVEQSTTANGGSSHSRGVLEQNQDVPSESYGQRLRKVQPTFKV